MPISSRLLYYDLGMNADDDWYAEWFTVMRMTGSSEQDLWVLKANWLIQVFDENVLVILDWKENNYIQKDRYTPSKYLNVYNMDTLCIQDVNTGKDRIGKSKDSDKEKIPPLLQDVEEYCSQRNNWIDAEAFMAKYNATWRKIKWQPIKSWKSCVTTREKNKKKREKEKEPQTDRERFDEYCSLGLIQFRKKRWEEKTKFAKMLVF